MANLSNINNILRTGSLGVGINRDPLGAFEISSATKPGVKMFNTSTNGKTYEAYSDTNGNYIIYDQDADDNRFVINTSGNATFTGNVSTGNLTVTNTTSGWTAYINNNIGSGTQSGLLLDAGSSSSDFAMYVRNAAGSSDFFAIKGNGNVGIGTDSPGNTLDVAGDTDITGQLVVSHDANYVAKFVNTATSMSNNNYALMVDSSSHTSNMSTAGAMSVDVNSGRAFTITGAGNVGIGADSPGTKLEIRQVDDTFDDLDLLTLKRVWSTASGSDRAHGIVFNDVNSKMATIYADRTNSGSNYNSQLLFSVNSGTSGTSMITPMVINNLGRVGIGTTSPDQNLQVNGSIKIANSNSRLVFGTAGGTDRRALEGNTSGSLLQVGEGYTDIALQGNVGIGTTLPGRKLTVTGDVSGDANNLLLVNENDTDGDSASIGFSMLSNNTYVKAGIFFKRTTTQGRGELILAVNNEVNSNNVTLSDSRLTINNLGDAYFYREIFAAATTGTRMRVPRNLFVSYGGSSFTYTFDPVALFGSNQSGGTLGLRVSGWQTRLFDGIIIWRNDGGGSSKIGTGVVTLVTVATNDFSGVGVSVSLPSANTNEIKISFSGFHSNDHGWSCYIKTEY